MPNARARPWLVASAIAVLALTLIAIPALAEDGTGGIPLPPPPPPDSGGGGGSGGSTTGYPNASEAQAENLFTNAFSGTVDSLASDPPDLSGQHPDFLNNRTAVTSPAGPPTATVDQIQAALSRDAHDAEAAQADVATILNQADSGDDDPARLVASTLPLQTPDASGQPAPVDLSLDQQGSSYQPQNPLVDLSLPDTITHDVAVGDQGLKVDVGASDPASADPIAGDNLFYADAAPATDVVLAPISTGLETLYQLRAPSSPDQFQMTLTLPDGASLSPSGDGGAQITRDGQTLAAVYPPSATDAAANPVPVSMTVAGDQLDLDVPHSDPGMQYPISVDPAIDTYSWSSNGAGTFSDWIQNKTVGSPYQLKTTCTQNVNCTSGTSGPAGLYVAVPQSSSVTAQSVGSWQYRVPHYGQTTGYISNLNLGPMYFANRGDTNANPFLFAGIYDDNGSYTASQGQTSNGLNLYWSLDPGSLKTGKQGVFALWSWTNRQLSQWRDTYLGGATVTLGDRESPVLDDPTHSGITFQSNGYSNWVDDATPTINAHATDQDAANANAGLGIKTFQFSIPYASGGADQTKPMGCTGANASPCPQSASSGPVSYDTSQMPNGVTVIGVTATDAMSNADVQIPAVRVDHARPRISLSGGLAPGGGSGGAYTLHIDATDGEASGSANWQSGVRQITLSVNGDPVTLSGAGPHNCTQIAGSCPLSVDYTLQPSDYTTPNLHLTVDGTDELGHHALGAGGQSLDWTVPLPDTSIDSGPSGPTNDATPTFGYSSPDSGASFQCRIDQNAFAPCGASGFTPSTALSEGQHSFSARATDSHGHIDATPAVQTFLVDQTNPQLDTSGGLAATADPLVGSDTEVGFDATDPASGVTSVEILVDGEQADEMAQDCPDGGCEFQDILVPDLTDDTPGEHGYEIVATDAAGNTTSQSGTFRLDPTPPTVDVTGSLADANGGPIDGDTADAQIDATDNATGDSGLASIQVSVDDTVDATDALSCDPACPASTTQAYTFNQADWGDGEHTVTITATDAAGNITYEDLDVDAPTPPPANCPEVMPTIDDPGQVLDASEAQSAAPSAAIAPSVGTFDDVTQTNFDPSLQAGESSPPDPLAITGSLITGELSSAPAGGFSIDYVVCMVPAQTTESETGATIVNGDSALYADSASDTDTIVRPTAGGVTAVNSLRGPETPASFQWKVGIPDGDQLTSLSNGGIAIVDPSREPESDLTIPDRPTNAEDPQSIPDAATQLAEKRYQVASAEQETGNAVLAVITSPYVIDADGNTVPTTLTLSGSDTVTVDSVADARAVVMTVADDQDKIDPPDAVDAFPIKDPGGHDALTTIARIDACKFADSQTGGTDPLILGFGSANKSDYQAPGGPYLGAGKDELFHKNSDIHDALQAAENHYRDCNKLHANEIITYGVSNYHIGDLIGSETAKHAGGAQVATIQRVNTHADDRKAVAGDIELGWEQPGISKILVNHASSSSFTYYDFGDAKNCPPEGASCDGNWTWGDVGAVSHNGKSVALPEIYHSFQATQWARVARHWDDADHNCPESGHTCYYFAGATSEPHSCTASLDPGDSWRHLKRNNPTRKVERALIYWNPDGCP